MASLREWVEGARLRTLSASIAPVIAGTGVAWFCPTSSAPDFTAAWTWIAPILCLIVGVGVQVGSNFSNDYSDGIRGTDNVRVGPQRLVGSGAATPKQVKRAAILSFAIACLAGVILVGLRGGWFLAQTWKDLFSGPWQVREQITITLIFIGVGLACVLAAWFYTGGKHPYGYAGLGEVFVFIFFGLVASVGTTFIQARVFCFDFPSSGHCWYDMPWATAILTGTVMGFLSVGILVANNLRDIDTDLAAGKHTLPTKLGDRRTRIVYVALIVASAVVLAVIAGITTWWVLLSLLGLGLVVRPAWRVIHGARGRELIAVLKMTGFAELATAILILVGLMIGWLHG